MEATNSRIILPFIANNHDCRTNYWHSNSSLLNVVFLILQNVMIFPCMAVSFDNYRYPINNSNVLNHSNASGPERVHYCKCKWCQAISKHIADYKIRHDNCQNFFREIWIRYCRQTQFWKMADEILHILAVIWLLDISGDYFTTKIPSYQFRNSF